MSTKTMEDLFNDLTSADESVTTAAAEQLAEMLDQDDLVEAVINDPGFSDGVEEAMSTMDIVEPSRIDDIDEELEKLNEAVEDKADEETVRDLAERLVVDFEEPLEALQLGADVADRRMEAMERVMHGGFIKRLRWLLTGKA